VEYINNVYIWRSKLINHKIITIMFNTYLLNISNELVAHLVQYLRVEVQVPEITIKFGNKKALLSVLSSKDYLTFLNLIENCGYDININKYNSKWLISIRGAKEYYLEHGPHSCNTQIEYNTITEVIYEPIDCDTDRNLDKELHDTNFDAWCEKHGYDNGGKFMGRFEAHKLREQNNLTKPSSDLSINEMKLDEYNAKFNNIYEDEYNAECNSMYEDSKNYPLDRLDEMEFEKKEQELYNRKLIAFWEGRKLSQLDKLDESLGREKE